MACVGAIAIERAAAQTPPPGTQRIVHERWTFKEGAPEVPTAFAQTADGYLWIGAPAGLFRFDGARFELFRHAFGEPLQSTNVSALSAAGDRLWVGYVFGGFSSVQNGRVRNFPATTGTITGFAHDPQGRTWAGARSGLWRFDGSSWQHVGAESNAPAKPAVQLGFDRLGTLWVLAGNRGPEAPKDLYFLPSGARQFRQAAAALIVASFTWDADGKVATTAERAEPGPDPLIRLQGLLPAYPILRTRSVQILDRAGGIWSVSTEPLVLRHPAGESLPESIGRISPGNSEAFAINVNSHARLVDREGSLWLGSDTGVHRLSYGRLFRQELPNSPVPWFMLAPDEAGAVWISAGNAAGTSVLYRVVDGKVVATQSLPGVSSFAYRAPDRTVWFGGEGGLWRLIDGRFVRIDLPQEMTASNLVTMTDDGSGGYWVSFAGAGFYRLKDGAWAKYQGQLNLPPETARAACPASGVLVAFTDASRRVWLGCTKGQLAVLDGEKEAVFGPGDGVQVGNVTAIYSRGSGVWIGGEFGLQHFDQGRFHAIRALDQESLRGISGIVETAEGDLWLNGLGGVVHITHEEIRKALKDPAHRASGERFDRRAGLPGLAPQLRRMPTAIEGTDGRLWFTVNNGVVWLDPTQPAQQLPPPPVSIQSVSADNERHELDRALQFPAGTANVQISYAAVSLLHPESIRYRYRVREIDDDWQEAGTSTSVSYRSLPPGHYHFEVGASDANGTWPDRTAGAEFTILPAYYQTAWFRALCAIVLLLLARSGYRLRIRGLRRQFEMTLDARVGERTRIARELHDTLLQSFHGLLLRFQTAFDLLPDRPGEAKQVLASTIEQAAGAITDGRDAVQGLRTSATEMNDLAESLRALGGELANENASDGSLRLEVQGAPQALHPLVRDEVFRIAGEALRNAFRHAGARQIEVELRYDERQLRLRVRDDGKGIDPEVLRADGRGGHFGLRGMRERADLVGGRLTVWSGPDAGTEVELSIPGSHAYINYSSPRSRLGQKIFGHNETTD